MPSDFPFPLPSNPTMTSNSSPPRPTPATIDVSEVRTRRHRIPPYSRNQHGVPGSADTPEGRRRRVRVEEIQFQEMNRLRAASHSITDNSPTRETQAPTSAIRSRPRATPSERHLQRNRLRRQTEGDALSNSISTVQDAVNRLTEASSNLSSLLDEPIPRLMSPDTTIGEWEGTEINRRVKRRKLYSDSPGVGLEGFSYGYRGQVVAGPLKMEIVSCDGGYFGDSTGHGRYYWPDNILRNDKSVYCTESNQCNIILRHLGETPFSLKKLVIKAPETGFSAPIQEGMIFVSMTSKELLPRTSQYHLREHSPPTPPPPPPPPPYDNPAVNRYELQGRMPRDYYDRRPPSRRADYPSARAIPAPISNGRPLLRRIGSETDRISNGSRMPNANHTFPLIDLGDDSTPPPRTMSPLVSPIFNVTTSCDASSDEEEEESSPAILADRFRRDHIVSPLSSSDDDDAEDRLLLRLDSLPRNRRPRRAAPRKIEWTVATEDGGADGEEQKKVEVLAPHARFFIEKDKSMISVKFDPPISGKFILLKLWSPGADKNIDIQSIIPYGFVGPRFFAATEWI